MTKITIFRQLKDFFCDISRKRKKGLVVLVVHLRTTFKRPFWHISEFANSLQKSWDCKKSCLTWSQSSGSFSQNFVQSVSPSCLSKIFPAAKQLLTKKSSWLSFSSEIRSKSALMATSSAWSQTTGTAFWPSSREVFVRASSFRPVI